MPSVQVVMLLRSCFATRITRRLRAVHITAPAYTLKTLSLANKYYRTSHKANLKGMAAATSEQPVQLDRDSFKETVQLKALRVPKQQCQRYMRLLKGYTFDKPRMRCIVSDKEQQDKRLVLLREDIYELGPHSFIEKVLHSNQQDGIEEASYEVTIDYSHLPAEQILRKLLPPDVEVPSSFETVGHIAHLNLRDEHLPYKNVIGQVLLDKNPSLRTVVNKVGQIETVYRVCPMEVIAGDPNLETIVTQHKARFKLNFKEVYWNSRLEHEHKRLVQHFKPSEVIADIMAGIGPFAIPAGLQGNTVYANDLNPRSRHYLEQNILLNKVSSRVHAFEMDGRAFIRAMCGRALTDQAATDSAPAVTPPAQNGASEPDASGAASEVLPTGVHFHHGVMNLPATAVEFLDAFNGAFSRDRWKGPLPIVHVYAFARGDEGDADVRIRVEKALGGPLDAAPQIHMVRDVAPNKRMLCISFRIPEAVGFRASRAATHPPVSELVVSTQEGTAEGPKGKRQKFEADEEPVLQAYA